jgi:glycosyltransferase involved in cell wall biosynthesis
MQKYSVLMSLYIKEKPEYLKMSINSMLSQTIIPDEIVVVKDGPLTDELESVLSEYREKYPKIFNIILSEKNIGLGLALNLGLSKCENELIARMDTDDISKRQRCEKQLKEFEKDNSLDIVGSYVDEFFDEPDKVLSTRKVPTTQTEIYNFAKRRSAFNHPAVMYRKECVQTNNGYKDLRRNQDVDLFGRMLFSGCKAKNISEPLLLFRSNDNLARRRKSWENSYSYILTIKRFWKMGYASFFDYLFVAIAQTGMYLLPIRVQHWIYIKFLRG